MGRQHGFSLIELIIVIAVLAVVFAVSTPLTLSYIKQRTFDRNVEEIRQRVALAYSNSVQGVKGVDKGDHDADTLPDRVAWFVEFSKQTSGNLTYATGACTPDETPEKNGLNCLTDNDYRAYDLTDELTVSYDASLTNRVFISFGLINGQMVVWKASNPIPQSVTKFEVTFTDEASNTATMTIDAFGGISLRK